MTEFSQDFISILLIFGEPLQFSGVKDTNILMQRVKLWGCFGSSGALLSSKPEKISFCIETRFLASLKNWFI